MITEEYLRDDMEGDKPVEARLSAAVIRAAILDVIDGWEANGRLGEDIWGADESFANHERLAFCYAVEARMKQLSGKEQ